MPCPHEQIERKNSKNDRYTGDGKIKLTACMSPMELESVLLFPVLTANLAHRLKITR
jgi:hypothetical protein